LRGQGCEEPATGERTSWRGTCEIIGKGLAVGPCGAVGELLLLPDGNGFLEGIDDPAAGVEGGAAMGGGDRDEDAGFADGEAAEAMDDGDVAGREVLDGLGAEEVHLLQGHLLVGFVVEVQGWAATGVVANDAVENTDSSVRSRFNRPLDGRRVDGLTDESDHRSGWLGRVETAADRRQDRDLVAVLQDIAARAVLLVDGDGG